MKQSYYLALIRRSEFNDLFSLGHLTLNSDFTSGCDCNGKLRSLDKEYDFLKKIEKADIDSSFSFLIIQYCKPYAMVSKLNEILIQEVKYIYPLDEDSKLEFSTSFDERIRIEDPICDFDRMQKNRSFDNCIRGVKNVWQIFGFSDTDLKMCKRIVSDAILTETIDQLYSNNTLEGSHPLWVHIMRYERHSFYPKDAIVGYFMDFVHIYCNYTQQTQLSDETIEATDIFRTLSALVEVKLDDIYTKIESSAFVQNVKTLENNVDVLKVAVIYLKMRDEYTNGLRYDKQYIESCKRWGNDFILASYLLGATLGYDKTYDCLYDMMELSIFKSAEEISAMREQQETARRDAKEKMNIISQASLFEVPELSPKPKRTNKKTNKNGK